MATSYDFYLKRKETKREELHKHTKAIEGFHMATKHDHSSLLFVCYDPHPGDQIVFTQEFLETEKLKKIIKWQKF